MAYYYEVSGKHKVVLTPFAIASAALRLNDPLYGEKFAALLEVLGLNKAGVSVRTDEMTYPRAYEIWPQIVLDKNNKKEPRLVIQSEHPTNLNAEQQQAIGLKQLPQEKGENFMRANNAEGFGPMRPTLLRMGSGVALPESYAAPQLHADDLQAFVVQSAEGIKLVEAFVAASKDRTEKIDAYRASLKKYIKDPNVVAFFIRGIDTKEAIFTPNTKTEARKKLQALRAAIPEAFKLKGIGKSEISNVRVYKAGDEGGYIVASFSGQPDLRKAFGPEARMAAPVFRWLDQDLADARFIHKFIPPPKPQPLLNELQRLFPKTNVHNLKLRQLH